MIFAVGSYTDARRLYAVSEVDEGAVAVFDLDENGTLVFSGQQVGPGTVNDHYSGIGHRGSKEY